MGLGLGIFLIVVGAILSFTNLIDNAVNTNLDTLGWILIMIGLIMAIHGFGMLEYRKPEVGL